MEVIGMSLCDRTVFVNVLYGFSKFPKMLICIFGSTDNNSNCNSHTVP